MKNMPTSYIDQNQAVWLANAPEYTPKPQLKKNIQADFAIIGGGFTGVSTAYHFSRRYPNKKVVLLEAKTLGNGASGRNGGQMLNWARGGPLDDAGLRHNYQTTLQAMDTIEAIIHEHGLQVDYRRDGIYKGLTSAKAAERAHADVEHAQKLGLPLVYLTRREITEQFGANGFYGAVLDPTEGQLNGVQYVRAFRRVLLSGGVQIYEHTPVLKVEEGTEIRLETPLGEVRAPAILLATNAYTHHLGYFRRQIFPAQALNFATEPLTPEQLARIGWRNGSGLDDDYMLLAYITRTNDERIVLGGTPVGYKYLYNDRTDFPDVQQSRESEFQRMYGKLKDYFPKLDAPISHRWAGPVALNLNTVSGMMGVRGEHQNVFYALGYNGHGVVLANLAGEVITDIYAREDARWRGLPFYQPKMFPIPPEPLRWLGANLFIKASKPFRNAKVVFGG